MWPLAFSIEVAPFHRNDTGAEALRLLQSWHEGAIVSTDRFLATGRKAGEMPGNFAMTRSS